MTKLKPIKNPKDIEKKAIDFILKKEGWKREEVDIIPDEGKGYDLKKGELYIEVKGRSANTFTNLSIEGTCWEKLEEKKNKYFVYIVYNISKEPTLVKIPGELLLKNKNNPKILCKKPYYQIYPNRFPSEIKEKLIKK